MTITIGTLADALCEQFPVVDGEPWDFSGLFCGDREAVVTGVSVSLDPTTVSVRRAVAEGANVLLTHHPVYIQAPDSFLSANPLVPDASAVVYEAISRGVAIINFHTALDVSPVVKNTLLDVLELGVSADDVLEPLSPKPGRNAASVVDKGYGRIASLDAPLSVSDIAGACDAGFGGRCRVWDAGRLASRICCWSGSAGDAARRCIEQGVDLLICGEIKYHDALDAKLRGLSVIDLGHDVSENPFCDVLSAAALEIGAGAYPVFNHREIANWTAC